MRNPSKVVGWAVVYAALASIVVFAPRTARADYVEKKVRDGGKIVGKVTFEGKVPDDAVVRYPIPGKSLGCGTGYRKVVRIDVKGNALRGVFVLIEEIAEGKAWPKSSKNVVLEQKDCVFLPSLKIVERGNPLVIRNSDDGVLHNVNLREVKEVSAGRVVQRMLFNIAQPNVGDVEKKVRPRKSPFLTVGCDVHNFMVAHMVAPEHPYATIAAGDGSFTLEDVPPGEYQVVAWHPVLGTKRRSVTVTANGKVDASFSFGGDD